MPIPAPVPFDIAPALSQYQTGIQTRVGLQDRQREWEAQATDAIMRAADLADTPEKWQRFITQIGSQFDGADLADATWENRDYYLSGNPQYRAQQERNRAAGAAASASAAAAATRQRRLSELVGGSAPAAGWVPAGAGGIPTLGAPRTGPPALSALGGATAPAQQLSAEEAHIPGMETPTPPPPAPLAAGATMPMLGTPTAAPTFNAQANSQLVAMGFNPEQIAAIQQAVASGDPRQLEIVENALTAAQERMLAGPAAPDYAFTEVGNTLVRTDANAGTATPVYAPGAETGERPMTAERRAYWGISPADTRPWVENADGTNPRVVGGNPPSGGIVIGPDGEVTIGGPANVNQAAANTYATRMEAAGPIIEQYASSGQNILSRLASGFGVVGNIVLGAMDPNYQLFAQAARDFINASLRRESGAVIAESEFQNAQQQYLPMPGDTPDVLAQKRRNRELQTYSIRQASGPFAGEGPGAPGARPADATPDNLRATISSWTAAGHAEQAAIDALAARYGVTADIIRSWLGAP